MLSNAYLLAKIRFDTAENEPAKNLPNFEKCIFEKPRCKAGGQGARGRSHVLAHPARELARGVLLVHRLRDFKKSSELLYPVTSPENPQICMIWERGEIFEIQPFFGGSWVPGRCRELHQS